MARIKQIQGILLQKYFLLHLESTTLLTTKSLTSHNPLNEQHGITNGVTHDAYRLPIFPTAAFRHHDIQ